MSYIKGKINQWCLAYPKIWGRAYDAYVFVHDKGVAIYHFCLSSVRKICWTIYSKNNDQDVMSQQYSHPLLCPIHVVSWHYGAQYFEMRVGYDKYFVKKHCNKTTGNREKNIYSYINKFGSNINKKILPLLNSIETSRCIYNIFPYVDSPTLSEYLRKEHLTTATKENLCKQMFDIYQILKTNDVAHNDLRTDNFFVNGNSIVLFDLGYACQYSKYVDFVNSLNDIERATLNKKNQIGRKYIDDAFTLFYSIKEVDPELYSTQRNLWEAINSHIGENMIQLFNQ